MSTQDRDQVGSYSTPAGATPTAIASAPRARLAKKSVESAMSPVSVRYATLKLRSSGSEIQL